MNVERCRHHIRVNARRIEGVRGAYRDGAARGWGDQRCEDGEIVANGWDGNDRIQPEVLQEANFD